MLLLVMALIWSLVQLPVVVAASFGLLLANRIVLGAAEGPAFAVSNATVHGWFDDRHRALPSSLIAIGATARACLVDLVFGVW